MAMSRITFERFPSVPDDDLFGEGSQSTREIDNGTADIQATGGRDEVIEQTGQSNNITAVEGSQTGVLERNSPKRDTDHEENSTVFGGCIPNFDMLIASESLRSDEWSGVQMPFTLPAVVNNPSYVSSAEKMDHMKCSTSVAPDQTEQHAFHHSVTEESLLPSTKSVDSTPASVNETEYEQCDTKGYKKHLLYSRSISEASGKQRHQRADEFCQEPFGILDKNPVRKSYSLPDLILNISPRIQGAESSPDVVLSELDQHRKKHVRESFEGKSCIYMSKDGSGEVNFSRSVSFRDKNDYIGDNGEAAVQQDIHGLEQTRTDTGNTGCTESQTQGHETGSKINALVLNVSRTTDECSFKKMLPEKTASTPTTPEGRRLLFSMKSSGYGTGSEESQGKGPSGISNMSDESFDWQSSHRRSDASNDDIAKWNTSLGFGGYTGHVPQNVINYTDKQKIDLEHTLGISNKEQKVSDERYSPANSSNSSLATVVDPSTSLNGSVTSDTHSGGSREHLTDSTNNNKNLLDGDTDDGFEDGQPEHTQTQQLALKFMQAQRSLGHSSSMQSSGLSTGNVPLIVDDSFQLPTILPKVEEEDKKQHAKVVNDYCGTSPTVLGAGAAVASTRSTTSLPDGGKGMLAVPKFGPGYMLTGGHSFIQSGPKSQDIKKFEGILQINDFDEIRRLLDHFRGSDSSTPSASPLLSGTSPQIAHTALDMSPEAKLFTVTDLEKASRCTVCHCSDPSCRTKWEIDSLLATTATREDSALLNDYSMSLWQHCEICSDCKCLVAYCSLVQSWFLDEIIPNIKQLQQNPVLHLQRSTDKKYIKLSNSVTDDVPCEYVTYTPLSVLGSYGAAILAMDTHSAALCVIKEYPQFEDGHQAGVYGRLRNLSHAHLVPQLWLLEYTDDIIHVCSAFMSGGSLKAHLSTTGTLSWPQTVGYMVQITDAIYYLHSQGIVYLYWQSENMYFSDTRKGVIKVGNFSLSCPLTQHRIDLGATKECLPYNICPPELLCQNSQIVKQSDVWGAGCLLAEMLTGSPVWHEMRHSDRATVHKKIMQDFPVVDVPSGEQERVLHSYCWQIKPERRKTMEELKDYFTSTHSRIS